jgi:hypothetical protein
MLLGKPIPRVPNRFEGYFEQLHDDRPREVSVLTLEGANFEDAARELVHGIADNVQVQLSPGIRSGQPEIQLKLVGELQKIKQTHERLADPTRSTLDLLELLIGNRAIVRLAPLNE